MALAGSCMCGEIKYESSSMSSENLDIRPENTQLTTSKASPW